MIVRVFALQIILKCKKNIFVIDDKSISSIQKE